MIRRRRRAVRRLAAVVFAAAVAAGLPATAARAATPRTVTIQVVPVVPGVLVGLDGAVGATDAAGIATLTVTDLHGVDQRVVLPPQVIGTDVRVSLDRVAVNPDHGAFTRVLVAELDVQRLVSFSFRTPEHRPYPADRITSMVLKDSLGRLTVWRGAQLAGPDWITASRPVQVAGGIKNQEVRYSVQSVTIDGTNVVHQGQVRFSASDPSPWTIPLTLYDLTVVGTGFLSGKPLGKNLKITLPNGVVSVLPLGPTHAITLTDIPPGDYKVRVTGGALPVVTTTHLSTSLTVTGIVITGGDLATLAGVALVGAVLLVMVGVLIRRHRRRRRAARMAAGGGPPAGPDGPDGAPDPEAEQDPDAVRPTEAAGVHAG